ADDALFLSVHTGELKSVTNGSYGTRIGRAASAKTHNVRVALLRTSSDGSAIARTRSATTCCLSVTYARTYAAIARWLGSPDVRSTRRTFGSSRFARTLKRC